MGKNIRLKVITFIAIFTVVQMLASANVFASRALLDDAIDRLATKQFSMLGARWLMRFVAKNQAYLDIAIGKTKLYNDIENNLKQNIARTDAVAVELKGPKGGGISEETKVAGIDMEDCNRIRQAMIEGWSETGDANFVILQNLEIAVREHPFAFGAPLEEYDANFDFNNDGYVTISDELMIRNVAGRANVEDTAVFEKLMRAVQERMGLTSTDGNFISVFDVDNDADSTITVFNYDTFYNHNPDAKVADLLGKEFGNSSSSSLNVSQFATSGLDNKNAITSQMDTSFFFDSKDFLGYEESQDEFEYSLSGKDYNDFLKAAMLEDKSLEETMKDLQNKEDKTDMNNKVLEVVQAAIRDEGYIDEGTMDEFKKAVNIIGMIRSMKDMLEGVDFTAITLALENLIEAQETLYDRYLSKTEKIYKQLETLLDINLEELMLPDQYLSIPRISEKEKRKILIDLALKEIARRDEKELQHNEKEALRIYKETLLPLENRYKEGLKQVLEKFIFAIKKTITDIKPVSISKEKDQFKALFILDSKKK